VGSVAAVWRLGADSGALMEGMAPGRVPYAQEGCIAAVVSRPVVSTDTSDRCAYRVRIKFLLRIILASHTYSSNWACRQHPLKRLSSLGDQASLPESDTGPFYLALYGRVSGRRLLF
jgi:hypothetical protein